MDESFLHFHMRRFDKLHQVNWAQILDVTTTSVCPLSDCDQQPDLLEHSQMYNVGKIIDQKFTDGYGQAKKEYMNI